MTEADFEDLENLIRDKREIETDELIEMLRRELIKLENI